MRDTFISGERGFNIGENTEFEFDFDFDGQPQNYLKIKKKSASLMHFFSDPHYYSFVIVIN